MYCNVVVVVVGSAGLRWWVDGLISCRDFESEREREREKVKGRECDGREKIFK